MIGVSSLFVTAVVGALVPGAMEELRLEGRVVDRKGDQLIVDLGASDGVEPGDRVVFRPLGRGPLEARVVSVADRSASVELIQGRSADVEIGTACEIFVPEERLRPTGRQQDPEDPVPNEPPVWNHPEPAWDQDRPLLSARPQRPKERESIWSGRVYAIGRFFREQEYTDSTSTFVRTGIDLRGENPFGAGGRLRFALDIDQRSFSGEGSPSESEFNARLERFSYANGGDRFRSFRWEVGRFLQDAAPSLGLLDGVELGWTLSEDHRLGASVGWMPEQDAELSTGTDFQIAAIYAYEPRALGGWRGSIAAQKTWHDGEEDRDLFVLRLERPVLDGVDFRATAWLDQYDSTDFGKESGTELTLADLRWSSRGSRTSGWSAGLRQWRFPSLLRQQSGTFFETDLFEGETTRLDVRGWKRVGSDLRLSLRADQWDSQDRDGVGAELRMDWDELFGGAGTRTGLALYRRTGSFVELTGLRVDYGWQSDWGTWRLSWDSGNYAPRDAGDDDLLQHDLRFSLDGWSTGEWSWSVDMGYRFGDEQNSPSLGFFVQRRF